MNTNLKELRKLVRESLKEFNTNAAGGANQPIHAFTVPNQPSGIAGPSEVPPNPEDIANAIVVAVKHLVDPIGEDEGESARRMELESCRRILAPWIEYPDAFNSAAQQAAETLLTDIDVTGITHSKNAGTLSYE